METSSIQNSHANSYREYGTFYFNNARVITYGLYSAGGGATTILNFLSPEYAIDFENMFLKNRDDYAMNVSQIIVFDEYQTVVPSQDEYPNEIEYLTFSASAM